MPASVFTSIFPCHVKVLKEGRISKGSSQMFVQAMIDLYCACIHRFRCSCISRWHYNTYTEGLAKIRDAEHPCLFDRHFSEQYDAKIGKQFQTCLDYVCTINHIATVSRFEWKMSIELCNTRIFCSHFFRRYNRSVIIYWYSNGGVETLHRVLVVRMFLFLRSLNSFILHRKKCYKCVAILNNITT